MRLLDRYLFRELLTPLAFCLGGFLIFWISWDLFTELPEMQERKLHLLEIIEYSLAMTPGFLATILPVVLLLALLYSLTNHARHNEITAMRAAGISLWRLCVPHLAVGLAVGGMVFALNEWCAPLTMNWANQILTRYVQKPGDPNAQDQFRKKGFTNARSHRTWFIGEYRLATAEMINPKVSWRLPNGKGYLLSAERAIRTNGVWTFFNVVEYEQTNDAAPLIFFFQTNQLARPEFDETPQEILSEIKISKYLSTSTMHRTDVPLRDIYNFLRLNPNLPRTEVSWLLTELYGRLAAPWTCLVVVFIAIPFGVASGRRNLFVGVAGSIFICFSYFVIQKVSLALGAGGHLPPWLAAWLPNLVFGATGLVLMARVR